MLVELERKYRLCGVLHDQNKGDIRFLLRRLQEDSKLSPYGIYIDGREPNQRKYNESDAKRANNCYFDLAYSREKFIEQGAIDDGYPLDGYYCFKRWDGKARRHLEPTISRRLYVNCDYENMKDIVNDVVDFSKYYPNYSVFFQLKFLNVNFSKQLERTEKIVIYFDEGTFNSDFYHDLVGLVSKNACGGVPLFTEQVGSGLSVAMNPEFVDSVLSQEKKYDSFGHLIKCRVEGGKRNEDGDEKIAFDVVNELERKCYQSSFYEFKKYMVDIGRTINRSGDDSDFKLLLD